MLIFRRDPESEASSSPQEMQAVWKDWQDWITSLTARNRFGSTGKRLGIDGKVLKPDKLVTDGPSVELKETVVGYMFIKADSLKEAVELAKGSPNLTMGGTVEVRPMLSNEG
jgi:hypothetical protein